LDTYLAVASKRDWRSYADRPVPEAVQRKILDAGRLAGSAVNKQPWTFVVVESGEAKERVADTVYAGDNVRTSAFAVAIVTEGGSYSLDVGRAMQNMMLAAWNEGVASCPNGLKDPDAAAKLCGGEVKTILSFGYPAKPRDPESRSADDWSAQANRKPLDELVRRI
jgi:nitroreductase